MGQVLQIPNFKVIYIREVSSKMYSTGAFFLACLITSTANIMMYPIVTSCLTFWWLGVQDSSIQNFLQWTASFVLLCIAGSCFGFMFGCIFDREMTALMMCQLGIVLLQLGAGSFSNLGDGSTWFVRFLG